MSEVPAIFPQKIQRDPRLLHFVETTNMGNRPEKVPLGLDAQHFGGILAPFHLCCSFSLFFMKEELSRVLIVLNNELLNYI